ncbi:MAG: hypothetical protein H6581_24980 [Bacteroidia bacterium]|nr:hypothetical protein [Bacteroidia bacterium]
MPETITIQKPVQPRTSLDWAELRRAGIAAIERYGSRLWTDYNSHDPGITLLEALCYAITDLGYRTDWPIEDLLASYAGSKILGEDFFPAHVILPNYPWTPTDFRKLIIDFGPIPWTVPNFQYPQETLFPNLVSGHEFELGIQNVWLLRAIPAERRLFLNEERRSAKEPPTYSLTPKTTPEEILLNGLYETHLLFEENPELPADNPLRDLNLNYVRGFLPADSNGNAPRYTLTFPYWDQFDSLWYLGTLNSAKTVASAVIGESGRWERLKLKIDLNGGNQGNIPAELYLHLPEYVEYIHPIYASHRKVKAGLKNWPDLVATFGWLPIADGQQGGVNSATHILAGNLTESNPALYSLTLKFGGQTFDLEIDLLAGNYDLDSSELQPFQDHLRLEIIQFLQMRQDAFTRALTFSYDQTQMTQAVNTYAEKLRAIFRIIEGPLKQPEAGLKSYLCAHRNLCEDWVRFRQVPIEEIGVESELILAGGFDEKKIMATAWHRIGRFLSPMVRYRSLEEMLESGQTPDQIFEGPLLKHGFIDTNDLELPQRQQEYVYTSDLLRILMDIEGVQAVNRLTISGYVDGRQVVKSDPNCIELEKIPVPGMPGKWNGRRRPRLNLEFSQVSLFRDDAPLQTSPNFAVLVFQAYSELEWIYRTQRIPQAYDLTTPTGTHRQLDEWQAIQEDLPLHYGVGEEGLPESATEQRKGQAKQLKGFMLFFDQLLANYVSQLSNLREHFSFHDQGADTIQHTYFAQPLYPTAEVQALLLGAGATEQDWQNFIANQQNPYLSQLWQITEDQSTFLDRRNRFLEHLMARFGESFAEYSLRIFALNKDLPDPWDVTRQTVIEDQKVLLQDLPVIGPQRGKGYCYRKRLNNEQTDVWDTANVAGVKRRLCRLLGIRNFDRRHLVDAFMPAINARMAPPEQSFEELFEVVSYRGNNRWRLTFGPTRNYVFEGAKYWPEDQPELGQQLLKEIVDAAQLQENFLIDPRPRSKYAGISLAVDLGDLKIQDPKPRDFLDDEMAKGVGNAAILLMMELLHRRPPKLPEAKYLALPEEGFHVIEHILFRPVSNLDIPPYLMPRLPFDEFRPGGKDPFSFRVTVILPLWTGRFVHAGFRHYVERMIRLEMPAQVWTDIIWVKDEDSELARLRKFEETYRNWLEQNAQRSGETAISNALRACVNDFMALQDYYIFNPVV